VSQRAFTIANVGRGVSMKAQHDNQPAVEKAKQAINSLSRLID